MANQRVTDLDAIITLPDSGIIHVVDTTNNTQDAAGSSFKITKANLLKENTAAILLNTAKVGISTAQATAITNNTNKVSFDTTISTRLANTSGTNTGDQNLSTFAKFLQVATYAALITITTPAFLTVVKVLNDEDKGIANATYFIFPDGVRMWVASTIDI